MPANFLVVAGTKNFCPGTRMARSYGCPAISFSGIRQNGGYPFVFATITSAGRSTRSLSA
jgi:hypothetical protein